MRKNYLLAVIFLCLLSPDFSWGQMTGGNIFLPGHWLEIGQLSYGAFGAPSPPAIYHPYGVGATLAEVYDYGHDGWTTGTPALFGDYTYPGGPFEGWGIQVNGTGGLNWAFCNTGITGTGSLTGANVSYVSAGGKLLGNWAGTAAGGQLSIKMETRVDTEASAVVMTVFFHNTGTTTLNNIYYMRSCDPDDDETYSFNFATNNTITYQNDADHRVLVSSTGQSYTNAYLGLGTKDCRAKALIYNSWPINYYVTDLSTVYTGTAAITPYYTGTHNGDIAIGLVYSLGNIAAGDSAAISYSYIFNGTIGLDSAFADPQLVVNGVPIAPSGPAPAPTIDTFDACSYPGGITTLSVDVINASDKDWTWSTWTWSPSTGLAATTGVSNTINLSALPPTITYTITGDDSSASMYTCNHRVMYLTIKTCLECVNNSPCYGDTLTWNLKGDSTGATYKWYGPAPSTAIFSTLQSPFKYPATYADSGMYHVIKTVGSVHDTDSTYVTIHHKPVATASSNSPLCQDAVDTLLLFASADITPVTYSWSGPLAFTSALQSPSVTPFSSADTGIYSVIVTSTYGCKGTASTDATVIPPPAPPTVTDPSPYCQGNTFVPFTVTGAVGTVYWYSTATGGTASTIAPIVNTYAPGTYTYWYSQQVGSCEGPRDSIKVVVNPLPANISGTTGVCQYFTTTLSDASTGGTWMSSTPAVATIGSATGIVTGVTGGTATITYKLPTGCYETTVVTIHPKPAPPALSGPTYCQYQVVGPLVATGTSLTWYGTGITAGYAAAPTPSTAVPGVDSYYVTQTSSFGCVSDSALDKVTTIVKPSAPLTRDTTYCQFFAAPPLTATGSNLKWYQGGILLAGDPVPSNSIPGDSTWYVTQTVSGCQSDSTPLTVTTIYKPQFTVDPPGPAVCQFDSIKLSYNGPALFEPVYYWQIPNGSFFMNGTTNVVPVVVIKFDSANQTNTVYLTVSDNNGMCSTTDTVVVNVVAQPVLTTYIKPDICLGDTITLALAYISSSAFAYDWYIDGTPMGSSPAINMVSASSNSGGPFLISWTDSGTHIIKVITTSDIGCVSKPFSDTINVHPLPDASFMVNASKESICLEDSVLFTAKENSYEYSYYWAPAHSFRNLNKPSIYGIIEQTNNVVTLTVTDPFGCAASTSQEINPQTCCTIVFPSAFTPNGDTHNNLFRPVPLAVAHKYHNFRIANRWGQTIYESASATPQWDGNYNGVPQDMGVYYYFIKYDCDGKTVEQKGDVTLVR